MFHFLDVPSIKFSSKKSPKNWPKFIKPVSYSDNYGHHRQHVLMWTTSDWLNQSLSGLETVVWFDRLTTAVYQAVDRAWPWETIDNQPSDRKISYLNTILWLCYIQILSKLSFAVWWFINYESAICILPPKQIRKRGSKLNAP